MNCRHCSVLSVDLVVASPTAISQPTNRLKSALEIIGCVSLGVSWASPKSQLRLEPAPND